MIKKNQVLFPGDRKAYSDTFCHSQFTTHRSAQDINNPGNAGDENAWLLRLKRLAFLRCRLVVHTVG